MTKTLQTKYPAETYLKSDEYFNLLYPQKIQNLSRRHWTPLHITRLATSYLGIDNARVLDIGSGAGKFCLAAACYAPNAHFFGIEQRANLIQNAKDAQSLLDVSNVSFIHGSFTEVNFHEFDSFYFFNSFYENINSEDRIDEEIEYSESLYKYYSHYLYNLFKQLSIGTKIATYHCYFREVPDCYRLVESYQNSDLNFWIKVH
jgi:SAM-dependent methyltransferase